MSEIIDGNKIVSYFIKKEFLSLKRKVFTKYKKITNNSDTTLKSLKTNSKPNSFGIPSLAIIVASNAPEIKTYINAKQSFFEKHGLPIIVIFSKHTYNDVKDWILKLNKDPNIGGIILQLPVTNAFKHRTQELIDLLDPKKDVEGLTSINTGQLFNTVQDSLQANDKNYIYITGSMNLRISPSVCGIFKVLEYYKISYSNKFWGVIGFGKLVGRPLINVLTALQTSFIALDKYNFEERIKEFQNIDILVTGTGTDMSKYKQQLTNILKKDVIIFDAGTRVITNLTHKTNNSKSNNEINNIEILSDLSLANNDVLTQVARLYTPPIGSLGPLTVYCLAYEYLRSLL